MAVEIAGVRGQQPGGHGRPFWGRSRTEQILTAQGFILILAVGTGADTITDSAGCDAAPPVMT